MPSETKFDIGQQVQVIPAKGSKAPAIIGVIDEVGIRSFRREDDKGNPVDITVARYHIRRKNGNDYFPSDPLDWFTDTHLQEVSK